MTVFYLVRHGANDFIGNGKLAGWLPGIHLNETGAAQAHALAEILKSAKLRAVYASPLERTMETAEPIAASHGLDVEPRPGIGEVKYGRWQGQSLKVLRRRKLWPTVQRAPSLARFPDGESIPEAQARIVAELEAYRAEHKSPKSAVVCVSHADIIKLAIAHYIGLPLDLYQRLIIEPASISILIVHDGQTRLARLNDTRAARMADDE